MADYRYETAGRVKHGLLAVVGVAGATLLLLLATTRDTYLRNAFRGDPSAAWTASVTLGLLGVAFGLIAIREGLNAIFAGVTRRQGIVTWRNLTAWTLYVLLIGVFAHTQGLTLNTLLLGGAVATIVLATLAQTSLSGIFAGLVLMLVRPYRVGEQIYLRTGQFGGAEYEGIVVDIDAFYTTLSSRGELVKVPNTSVITSVLMTRYRPRRADLEIEIPADSRLDALEDSLRDQLSLGPGSRVRLDPIRFSSLDGTGVVRVKLQVFSDHAIDSKQLVHALDEALAGKPRANSKTVHLQGDAAGSSAIR